MKWLNAFPNKNGVKYISPRVLLTGKNIDYKRHCRVPFGRLREICDFVEIFNVKCDVKIIYIINVFVNRKS